MLSKLKKISKDLILYSVLASDFERLDFKNDALAGVRANYFNAKCSPQVEKTDVTIENRVESLSYSMKQGEPLSWKITFDKRPVQTVKRSSDGGYCVMSYGDNGIIFKRQYFDNAHLWLRTEYYDRALESQMAAVLFPVKADGLIVLRYQRFLHSGIESVDLFPSLQAPKKRCAALIYSNSGMIWYDSAFKPENMQQAQPEQGEDGFRFSKEAFLSEGSNDLLDLANAPYLTESDIPSQTAPPEQPEVPEAPSAYSAYEQIERILFEAHKTNKNIFGELASHADREKSEEEPIEESSEKPVEEPTKEPVEEPAEEPVEEPIEEPAEEPAEEHVKESSGEESKNITTKNGDYSYFGALDANNKRTGRGRTVTPGGITAYDGDYLDDKRHGFGVCYYKEGSPNYVGDWQFGNRSGRGVGFRLSDGTMHAGKWNSNKPDGFGARFDSEGNFLDVCTYVDGVRNGKSVSFDEDGNLVVRFWKDGELMSEKIISD